MRLASRLARAELRGGLKDFWLFLACLVIGTSVIAAVGSLSASVTQSILSEAKTLLGGDVSLSTTNRPLTDKQKDFIRSYGAETEVLEMRAMASFGSEVALVELKGVADNYPLIGTLESKTGKVLSIKPGTVLVAEDLLGRLSANIGDTITLGPASFKIGGVIGTEPDRMNGAFGLGPRVLARTDDLAKVGLTGPEELIKYYEHVLLTKPAELEQFKDDLKNHFPDAAWSLRDYHDANQGTSRFVARLQLFLTLAGLTTLLIGGIGILNATEAYMVHKIPTIAVMKALGAGENLVFLIYAVLLGLIALLGAVMGAILGGVSAFFILPYLAQFFPVNGGGAFHPTALLEAAAFGLLTVSVFVIAILGRAISTRPALLFRASSVTVEGQLPRRWLVLNGALLLILINALIFTSSDREISAGFIGSAIVSVILFTLLARLIQFIAGRRRFQRPFARLAASNIARPGSATLSVILSIGISLTVLIALLIVEGNFRNEINETIPAEAPALFFIDIQPAQREAFESLIASDSRISDLDLRPMIRGRIATLNGTPVEKAVVKDEAKWALESDRGLSFADEEPDNSPVVEGQWWHKNYRGPPLISLDRKLAEGMGLKIGDHIGLNIMGQSIEGTIANLRDVNYLTLQINFSMILSPGAIEQLPMTFLATGYVNGGAKNEVDVIRRVTKAFPNISTVAVRDQLEVLSELIDHVAFAIRVIALITLFCGLLVLASSLVATLDKRSFDVTIFKVLGAGSQEILRSFFAEWLTLAVATSLIASALGIGGAWLILQSLHWDEFEPLPLVILSTCAAAIFVMMVIGTLIHSRVLRKPSLQFLRNE